MRAARLCQNASMAINRPRIAYLKSIQTLAYLGATLPLVARTSDLMPTDMAEVVGVISVVMRETKGLTQGLTLLLGGATSWLLIWLSQSPLMLLKRITIALWNFGLILRVSPRQRI